MSAHRLKIPPPARPSLAYAEARIREFDGDPRYFGAEKAVGLVFSQWPANRALDEILVKVVVLNRLYSTNIYDVYGVAAHIARLGIDGALAAGDASIVPRIAEVVSARGATRRHLSFASKYCAWHRPDDFQIYDGLVDEMLWAYRAAFDFADFRRADLRDYTRFLAIIEAFRRAFGLESPSRKQLDKFLWIEGRRRNASKPGPGGREAFAPRSGGTGATPAADLIRLANRLAPPTAGR